MNGLVGGLLPPLSPLPLKSGPDTTSTSRRHDESFRNKSTRRRHHVNYHTLHTAVNYRMIASTIDHLCSSIIEALMKIVGKWAWYCFFVRLTQIIMVGLRD